MFEGSVHYYDRLYSFKDYQGEAQTLQSLLGDCRSVLDVACGTGEHHRYLQESFAVDGLDLNGELLEMARSKNSQGRYTQGDMREFDLGRTYDAVLCLFSSIGYLRQPHEIVACLRCLARHAQRLLLVEPWFTPDNWQVGRTQMLTYEDHEVKVCRMSRSSREGELAVMDCRFLVATSESLETFEEVHKLRLSTREEMEACFAEAGLECCFDPTGLDGRGLYRVDL